MPVPDKAHAAVRAGRGPIMDKRHARFAKAGGLILLCLALAGLAGWLFAKPLVEFLASRAVGHPVAIEGGLRLALFPRPGLSASSVTVAAPDWSARKHMLSVDRLSVALDPGALVRGRLVVDEARLAGPELFVERTAQGRLNWAGDAAAADGSGASAPALPLVRTLVVDAGRAVFHDHARGRVGATVAHALWRKQRNGPGALRANGSIGGRPWDMRLTVAPAPAGQALTLHLDAPALQASAQGRLGWPFAEAATDLRLRLEGSGLPWQGEAGAAPALDYTAGARLQGRGRQWRLSSLRVEADGSALHGALALDAGGARPAVSGQLTLVTAGRDLASELAQAWERVDAGGERAPGAMLARLRAFDARLRIAVLPEDPRDAAIRAVRMDMTLASGVLSIDPAVLRMAAGSLQAAVRLDTRARPVQGRLEAVFEDLSPAPLARLLAAGGQVPALLRGGRLQGKLALAFTSEQVKQAEASLRYRDRPGTDLHLRLESGGAKEPAVRLAARGTVRGAVLRVEASGDPLALFQRKGVAPFAIEGRLGATRLEASGRVVAPDKRLAARMALSGPGSAALERLLGLDLPQLPSYAASAQLVLDDGGLVVDDARVRVGRSRIKASGSVDDLSDPTRFRLALRAGRIVLSDFQAFAGLLPASGNDGAGEQARPALARLDGQLDLRAEQVVLVPDARLRDVRVEARLHDGRLVLRTLHADIGGGGIRAHGSIAGLGARPHGELHARIRDVQLGQVLRPFGLQRRFPGTLEGRVALEIGKPGMAGAIDTRSTLRYRAPASGSDIRISLRQVPGEIRFALRGRYRHEPFRLDGSAAPLRRLFAAGRYPFEVEFVALATHGRLQGSLRRPLRFDGLRASLTVEGPNPRRAEPVLGFRLPELPPYRLAGPLLRQDGVWTFGPFRGSVGNTDLSGRIVAAFPDKRPKVTASLHSRLLDLDDLGGVIGGAPGAGPGDVASGEQRRKTAELARRAQILPDEPFELEELGRMDAELTYSAERVEADRLPIDALSLRLTLSGGRLALSPLRATVAGGQVTARMRLAAVRGPQPPRGYLELSIADVRLGPVLEKLGVGALGSGRLHGYAAFDSAGASVAGILSSADGGMRLSLEGGKLDALLVELAGLDFGEALLHWLGAAGGGTFPVRCALIQARARDGVLDMSGSTLDTSDTRFTMGGQVRFPDERLALRIEAHPKDPSLLAARTPLLVEGRFRNPDFHPLWAGLAGRAAAAGALALVAPPAALLAFVEPGLGNSGPCGQRP